MSEFAERAAEAGLTLCYHHHMGTVVQSERDIDAFVAHTGPAVRLLLDTGHARWGGADPAALARAYRERIGHVHCKDVREAIMRQSNAGVWSFLDSILGVGGELGVYTVPGDGVIDYAAVFRELKGYSGRGGAGSRAGPEEGAGFALRAQRNRASRRGVERGRAGLNGRRT